MGKFVISIFAFCLVFTAVWNDQEVLAQEIHLLGGVVQERDTRDRSYSWAVQYLHGLNEHWAVSFSWLNEGHFEHHHRDGHTLQLWTRTRPLGGRVVLAAGIGPYRYYDTQLAEEGVSYVDSHGWGAVASLSATWQMDNRWLFSIQSNLIETSRSLDTFSVLAGIGYQLEAPRSAGQPAPAPSKSEEAARNEITLFAGQTIVNSRDSENSTALMVEYRRNLGRHFDWTVGYLNEGSPGPIKRKGMLTQLWIVGHYLDDRLDLGLGAGPYVPLDKQRETETGKGRPVVAGMFTMGAAYDILPRWTVRISWNRVVTDYDRDTDVLLGGIGYQF
mgnify:CR=1 FL=1